MTSGDTWLVNIATGTVEHVTNGPEAVALEGTGWKAFPTQAEAKSYSNQGLAGRITDASTSDVTTAAGKLIPGFSSVTDFLNWLTNPKTMVRLTEILIGSAMVLFSLNSLMNNPAGKAVSVAAVLPK